MYGTSFNSFGLVKSYEMPCIIESASMEPKYGNKFIAGGEDMWVHMFDFHTGVEIGNLVLILCIFEQTNFCYCFVSYLHNYDLLSFSIIFSLPTLSQFLVAIYMHNVH